jgi:hypothetical protein
VISSDVDEIVYAVDGCVGDEIVLRAGSDLFVPDADTDPTVDA